MGQRGLAGRRSEGGWARAFSTAGRSRVPEAQVGNSAGLFAEVGPAAAPGARGEVGAVAIIANPGASQEIGTGVRRSLTSDKCVIRSHSSLGRGLLASSEWGKGNYPNEEALLDRHRACRDVCVQRDCRSGGVR